MVTEIEEEEAEASAAALTQPPLALVRATRHSASQPHA